MAKGTINKVMLIGSLGKDPEIRYTTNQIAVAKFSIATVEKYKDQEHTDWHNIVIYGKLGELAGAYLKKGAKVYLEGRITTRSWDDERTGEKKYITEIIATQMQMLSTKEHIPDQAQPEATPEVLDDIPF
jgi:single-strand DNA-binding protein